MLQNNKKTQILKRYKYHALSMVLSLIGYLYLMLARNAWYADFYKAIEKKAGITFSIFVFIILSLIIVANDSFKRFVKYNFILKERESNVLASNQNAVKIQYDLAQRICEDVKLKAQHWIDFIDQASMGIGLILVFIPRMFFIAHSYAFFVLGILIIYGSFIFVLNFGYFKKVIQVSVYKQEENEGKLRKFFFQWLQKKCVRPIGFAGDKFENAQKSLSRYYFVNNMIEAVRNLYENIGLIIPFAIFYSLYHFGSISFAIFIQLVNLWTSINFAISMLAQAIEHYVNYDVSKKRLQSMELELCEYEKKSDYQNHISDCLKEFDKVCVMKNVSIFMNNKRLIENFNLEVQSFEKINIIGPNSRGKTTLMQTMQGFHNHEGTIEIAKNTLWIPEQPILPDKVHFQQSKQFINACKDFEIEPTLEFATTSGGQKWRLLAAYATMFDFVVWDDPFWGLEANIYLDKLIPKLRSCIIFSAQEVEYIKQNQSANCKTIFL